MLADAVTTTGSATITLISFFPQHLAQRGYIKDV